MPLALLTLLSLLLVFPSVVQAVAPSPGWSLGLPEGALLGLEEDAAALEAARAAARAAVAEPDVDALRPGGRAESPAPDGAPADTPVTDVSPWTEGVVEPDRPSVPVTAPGRGTPPAVAESVTVPLRLQLPFIHRLLMEQVFTEDGRARFAGDDAGCNELVLSDPQVRSEPATDTAPAVLVTLMQAEARIGLALLGSCTPLADWRGVLEVTQLPSLLAGGGGFTLGVADSRLTDVEGGSGAAGALWDALKSRVHERIAAVSVDLSGSLGALRDLLPQLLARQTAEGLAAILATLHVEDARAEPHGVTVDLRFTAPPAPPAAALPEPRLSKQELERFRLAVAQLDGFLTFVVRTVAGDELQPETRNALLRALLDGRHLLLEALQEGVPGDAAVRDLFVDLWSGLAPALAGLPGSTPGEDGLRYLAFITAGDVLVALEALGPGTGLDISADGLRRMARLLVPGQAVDPLERNDAVDEILRRRFGFDAILPPPRVPLPAPMEPEGRRWLPDWVLRPAAAATAETDPAVLGAALQDWAPSVKDLPEYLPLVRDLLHAVVLAEQQANKLPEHLHGLFRTLVLATAWQESCWRQFVRERGVVVTLRSSAGALGIMQVNRNVWRGFYDVDGLASDIAYNARAGAEIARHYLVDYAVRAGEDEQPGGLDNLAQAAYAAYNGGPGQLRRYRSEQASARLRAIDQAFLAKYRSVQQGDELAVASCYGA